MQARARPLRKTATKRPKPNLSPPIGQYHVCLQQAEEQFHGGVVTGRADVTHRTLHAVTKQVLLQFS